MYRLVFSFQHRRSNPLDAATGEIPTMRLDADRRPLAYGGLALHASPTGAEQGRTSRELSEIIVNVLVRDHTFAPRVFAQTVAGLDFKLR